MGSDAFMIPLIVLACCVIGVTAKIVISRIQANRQHSRSKQTEKTPTEAETISVLGQDIDIRELRILRALFGEPKGRQLGSFKGKYYRPSLETTIKNGWVKQVGSRYMMTAKGSDFCRTYLKQLLSDWKPEDKGQTSTS